MSENVVETVRRHYAAAALKVDEQARASSCATATEQQSSADACCATTKTGTEACCATTDLLLDEPDAGYDAAELAGLPRAAVTASLGCGNPTAVAELRAGERVLDLGSGGGIDVLLSAKRVGATGKAFGVDMTDEMLALARANAAVAGATNVEFLKGRIEAVPLPDASIDVVISNCVVNLSVDKPAVLAEMFRVLAPGGRIGVTDIVADNALTPAERAERGSYTGCIAGALSFAEFEQGLVDAGFTDVTITATHEAAPGLHAAIIRGTKPTV
jgi:arsenite methyltransferase